MRRATTVRGDEVRLRTTTSEVNHVFGSLQILTCRYGRFIAIGIVTEGDGRNEKNVVILRSRESVCSRTGNTFKDTK